MTPLERQIAEERARSNDNISKVARVLGIDYFALKERLRPDSSVQAFKPAYGPEPEDIRSLGKPGLQRFVIAIKRAGHIWPPKFDAVIADARLKFDAGTHEMFQTNNNGWVVQYLIPRMVPTQRRNFFRSMTDV